MLVDIGKFFEKVCHLSDGNVIDIETINKMIVEKYYEVILSDNKVDEVAVKDIEFQINKLREDIKVCESDYSNYLSGVLFGLSFAYNSLIKK